MQNPIIEYVSSKRFLPNKMVIYVREKPLILRFWNEKTGQFFAISEKGEVLNFHDSKLKLPLISGEFNMQDAIKLYEKLQNYNITPHLTDISSFFGYRFDLVLKRKIFVRLPENDAESAIVMLADLIENNKILEKNIKQIDFRVKGKIIIEYFKESEIPIYTPITSYYTLSW
jgi:cell division septal protein FtsQ